MEFHHHQLANGLTIVGETNPAVRSVAVGFFVRTGSRDESPELSGVSHYLEHMAFKGTPRRSALEVNRDFDRIGANPNAGTSEENTVYYCAVLQEYLPQAVDILADILRPSLRQDDFDTEKTVILAEIARYEDIPGSMAVDHARQLHFAEHPLGNIVLGSRESVQALTRDQMLEYFRRRYAAPNVVVAAAGHFDWPQFVRLVEERCRDWETGVVGRDHLRETIGSAGFRVMCKEDVTQEHVVLMAAGPSASSPLRHAACTLALALGDDTGSRLYWSLIHPGLADSADVSPDESDGTGATMISFSCEPEQTEENLAIVRELLADVQRDGITNEELQQAKSKIQSRLVRGSERPMGRMNAVGMSWTYLKQYRSVDDELQAFDAVSLHSIREVLDRYPLTRTTTLAYGPLDELRS
jgi:predicted Zn-dependent peptidase